MPPVVEKCIALVRGHHLSMEETVSYEPLRDRFDFVCISADVPRFNHSRIVFPVLRTASVERSAGLSTDLFVRAHA